MKKLSPDNFHKYHSNRNFYIVIVLIEVPDEVPGQLLPRIKSNDTYAKQISFIT